MTPSPANQSNTDAARYRNGIRLNDLSGINKDNFTKEYEAVYEPPNFTIKELRDCIPDHLFEKSLPKSLAYFTGSCIMVATTFYAATYIDTFPSYFRLVLWPAYWWFQGVFTMGLYVLGHECGHQSFSNYKWINNTVGMIVHTGLLVPYHNLRITHSQHHAGTGNIGEDQVYVPQTRSAVRQEEPSIWQEAIESSPLFTIFKVALYLLVGWPAYATFNLTGNKRKYPNFTTHFLPSSPLFQPKHRNSIIFSNLAVVGVLVIILYAIHQTSFWTVAKYYIIPYLIVTAWAVCITYLNHTDVYLPHYQPKAWNFVRGALTSCDRDFGWFINTAFHHVHDHHITHHLFSSMPHYNTVKATPYLKEKLGEYYLLDRTPWWKALYRAAKNCVFIEDQGDVVFYHRK